MNRLKPELVLRLSLAVMYLYSGIDIFTNPKSWTWAIPVGLKNFLVSLTVDADAYLIIFLKVQAVGEIIIAAAFLLWFLPRRLVKWLAFISALEMALILVFTGIDLVTFRDIGLLGASFALFLIYARR
ncbi:MAG: hypothetical protein HYT46_01705 [Candidatus Vogelbacteria bacterium]|nr:hypothetical protein [Candidatus Vogelbacteria bacterium]